MKYERPKRSVINSGYVYETLDVKYDPIKKRSKPKRELVGKMKDGEFIPNKKYFILHDLKLPNNHSNFIKTGAYIVINHIANKNFKLKRLLDDIFLDKANNILDIAIYMIIKGTDVMQHIDGYFYDHPLCSNHFFDDDYISKLLYSLKYKDINLFIKSWVNLYKDCDVYILYDSTNMSSSSSCIDITEYGHSKDNQDLPIVNVSLAIDQKSDNPLFYELYPGSIIDNTECQMMVDRARYYGLKNIGFILDRGYFSISNIRYFIKNKLDFILMCKSSASFINDILNEYMIRLTSELNNYDYDLEIYMMTIKIKLFEDKYQYVHLYYNGQKAEDEKRAILKHFKKAEESLDKIVNKKLTNKDDLSSYQRYFSLYYDNYGNLIKYSLRDGEIKKLLDKAGIFFIITSKKMSAKEALDIYHKRDAIEKIFRMGKSEMDMDIFRTHSLPSLESKIFIFFIALILRSAISNKAHDIYNQNRKEYTTNAIIKELEKIGITLYSDNTYHSRYKLTSKQKKILSLYDIDEITFKTYQEEIINKLNTEIKPLIE